MQADYYYFRDLPCFIFPLTEQNNVVLGTLDISYSLYIPVCHRLKVSKLLCSSSEYSRLLLMNENTIL